MNPARTSAKMAHLSGLAAALALAACGAVESQPEHRAGAGIGADYLGPEVARTALTVTGAKPFIAILCKYPDLPDLPEDNAHYQNLLNQVNAFWTENAYGALNLNGTTLRPTCPDAGCDAWLTLPSPHAAYVTSEGNLDTDKMATDCLGLVDAQVDFRQFYGAIMIPNVPTSFNQATDNAPLSTPRDGRTTMPLVWMSSRGFHETAHEVGHALGLPHLVPYPAPCTGAEGYRWDVMASNPAHTNMHHKDMLGWIPAARRYQPTVAGTQTVRLERSAQPPNAAGTFLMAKIPSASLPSTQYYVVEARRQIGADTVLPSEGVRIYQVDTTRWEQSSVVDPDGDSDVNEADSIFVPGESFRDPWSNTTIAVTAATASGYDLSITFDPAPCCGGNGLRGTYFPSKDFTGTSITRIDPTINFVWTDQNPPSSPDPAIPPDLFSARWAGELLVPTTGMYTFYSTPDDGVRVWIGGKLVIDSWLVQAFNERRGKIALTGGQRVPVVVEYFEESGGAAVNLSWSGPNIPKMIVPASRLFSAPATQSCQTPAAGAAWINTPFSSQNNLFTVEYDVTPRAKPIDAAVGLSAGAQSAFSGFATLTRFNTSGNIDVRNGGTYAADIAFAYSANQKYHFRLVGNLATRRYTVYVTPPGGSERVLALDYAFRSEQAGVTRLDSWGAKVNSATGSLDVCNFVLNASTPTLICKTGAAAGGFVNTSFPSQSGLFTAEYLGKASLNSIDGVIGLSLGAQTANTGFATFTRFNTSGNIDARNGSVFSGPTPALPYVASTRYQYRLLVNVATKRYCAYVTAPGGAETRIGEELSFRTEQLGVTSLNNYGVRTSSASGSTEACSFAVTAGP